MEAVLGELGSAGTDMDTLFWPLALDLVALFLGEGTLTVILPDAKLWLISLLVNEDRDAPVFFALLEPPCKLLPALLRSQSEVLRLMFRDMRFDL
jgi:hypothetical protein